MSYLVQIIGKMTENAIRDRNDSAKIASEVISGKKKISEVEILSRGGPGITRRTKKLNKRARKMLERRIHS